ncbi:MAG: hypothetical protein CM1200mP10_25700 [Candidatus Neomarinimicrobiota bacterium]|nr:MAG: hypothetical protein CM1200mP10_25700 [Candidatus Neomarinimicrobiota bacterium]
MKKKRGVREVKYNRKNISGRGPQTGPLAYSHMEGVIECPIGFKVVATSNMIAIEGIACKNKPIWGFLAHLEATGKIS